MAMGGKLGLGDGLLMGGGGRGGNVGVAEGVGAGDVGVVSDGLGETPIARFGCTDGLDAALVGAEAIWAGFTCSILIAPVVKPTLATTIAATLSQGTGWERLGDRLRFGSAITSLLYSSKAVAKSNSCTVLRRTTGEDSATVKEPKNKLWARRPRDSKWGGAGKLAFLGLSEELSSDVAFSEGLNDSCSMTGLRVGVEAVFATLSLNSDWLLVSQGRDSPRRF